VRAKDPQKRIGIHSGATEFSSCSVKRIEDDHWGEPYVQGLCCGNLQEWAGSWGQPYAPLEDTVAPLGQDLFQEGEIVLQGFKLGGLG
jgi:hypothetical protein